MKEPLLVFGEAAYLSLLARRTLNYRREAEQRGEVYNDMLPFTRLMCGAQAKLHFTETVTGYSPVVEIKYRANAGTEEEAKQIAEEIAGSEMILSKYVPCTSYTFTRKPT